MKIDNTNVGGTSPDRVEQNREAAVVRAGFDRSSKAGGYGADGDGDDQIDLSGLSRALNSAQSDSPERVAKVEQLAAIYAKGNYSSDPAEISRRVVEDALRP